MTVRNDNFDFWRIRKKYCGYNSNIRVTLVNLENLVTRTAQITSNTAVRCGAVLSATASSLNVCGCQSDCLARPLSLTVW
jgi:hypothetical protein